jgi:hypothetical protein
MGCFAAVGGLGGLLKYKYMWRACNLTLFLPCLTGPVDYLFASRHKGHRFKSPGGTYVKPGFSGLGLPRYIGDPHVIRSLASSPSWCFTRLHADNV